MKNAENAHVEEIRKHLLGVSPKPLEWVERSKDGYRLFQATTEVGHFSYGVDTTGQPYFQTPHNEEDTTSEEAARLAAEEQYHKIIFRQIAPFLVPAPKQGPAPEVVAELQALLAKYATDCEEARSWGGPTIYPHNPFTEDFARRYAKLLTFKG